MIDQHFISYSTLDAQEFAYWLYESLSNHEPSIAAWLDKRCLTPGIDWDGSISEALQRSRTVLFVMTCDSVREASVCKQEWTFALQYKKRIVPLRLHAEARAPFRLHMRQMINFVNDREQALRDLVAFLGWIETPAGRMQEVQDLLDDARRDLARDPSGGDSARIVDDIAEYERQIVHWQRIVDDPIAATHRVDVSIHRGIECERRPKTPVAVEHTLRFINPPPGVAPRYFQDREVETRLIVGFLADDSKRMVTVVGRGGVGKTAMVCRLLKALESGLLPDGDHPFVVDGIVYLSATGSHRVSMPNLFNDLCKLVPEEKSHELAEMFKEGQRSVADKMHALLESFPSGRTVVLLDNFETLVDETRRELRDPELLECLTAILKAPPHGVKILITTRIAPRDLGLVAPGSQSRIDLDEGLPEPFAENILRAMDTDGKVGLRAAPQEILAEARVRTRGYPRALEALFAILCADREASLEEILRRTTTLLPENVVDALVGEAFSRLDRTAQQLMQALAVYGLPVPPVAVDFLLAPHERGIDSAPTLSRLLNMQFVRKEGGRFYLHPIDSAYAVSRIEEGEPSDKVDDGVARFTLFALRHRAADYFRQTRKAREDWKSLEDLSPLIAEFDLRCQNSDYSSAFAVLSAIGFDYLMLWGYYRQLADMHGQLRGRLEDPECETSNLNGLGLALENLGEYENALQAYEEALKLARECRDRYSEAIYLGNKAICHVRLGETARAIDCDSKALAIARVLGGRQAQLSHLNNLGNRHVDLGEGSRAMELFDEALPIARELRNGYLEAVVLESSAHVLCDLNRFDEAADRFGKALTLADGIRSVQVQNHARWGQARMHLLRGDLAGARREAEAAMQFSVPENDHHVLLILGIACLRQGEMRVAADAFQDGASRAEKMLRLTSRNFAAMDTKAACLCGLILCGIDVSLPEVVDLFRNAREINRDVGIVRRIVQLLDTLMPSGDERLAQARRVAGGE